MLSAEQARRLAKEADQRDARALWAARKKCDDEIRKMSRQTPPIYMTTFRVPFDLAGIGQAGTSFNYFKVTAWLFESLRHSGFKVAWDDDDPALLLIDWSP